MLCCITASKVDQPLMRGKDRSFPHITWHAKTVQAPAMSIEGLPFAAVARILRHLPFDSKCQAACVCRTWAAIVSSAAAAAECEDAAEQSTAYWAATRTHPCDIYAAQESMQYQLLQCPAVRYVSSASVWLCSLGPETLTMLQGLTRLHLLDTRCDVDGRHFSAPAAEQAAVSLQHMNKLRVLNVGMASAPIVDFGSLPSSLQCLHLNLASGYSVSQLHATCTSLAAAAPHLPSLRHLSLGMELDALMRNSQGTVLNPLSSLEQLTSLALTDYQYMHPDAPAHEGYALVPPVLQHLHGLQQVDLRLCTGQHAQLAPAAGIPDVRLVLTLARHEQVQFNRLPTSLVLLTGLTSLSILMAEFVYEPGSDLFVFDASPLALCQHLQSLLLELHGMKSSQHDLRGLAQLQGLQELVVLFKCPDVHEARPEVTADDSAGGSTAGGAGVGGPGSASSNEGSLSGLSSWFSRTTSALRPSRSKRLRSLLGRAQSSSSQELDAAAAAAAGQGAGSGSAGGRDGSSSISLLCEEWVLQLLDTALDQLRPEFALTVPRVAGRLLLATTSRLLLRQPDMVCQAGQPLLLCSHLQLDCNATADMWNGECFLHRRSERELKAWVNRNWQPHGVGLLDPARYPQLGSYPGCRQRIDDKLLAVARKGVTGRQLVQTVMDTAEERCMAYFT